MRSRTGVLLLVVSSAGCRLAAEGLGNDLADAAVDGVVVGDTGSAEDTAPLFPLEDAAPGVCDGKTDGTACGTAMICVGQVCLPARCGDSIVSAGEDCDDGNDVDTDACNTACRYECTTDTQCDDGNPCSIDACDLAVHRCAPKTAAMKGSECMLPTGGPGVCNGTSCGSAECGNGTREGSEQCDDSNFDDADGCRSDCLFTCTVAADCDDKNACNGVETCDSAHRCVKGTPKVCNDSSTCTNDRCSLTTGMCVYSVIDNDGDGYGPGTGCGRDCHDRNPLVRPDQKNWFVGSYATQSGERSWDYDCDGTPTRKHTTVGSCTKNGPNCVHVAGWAGSVPACGGGEFWVTDCTGGPCNEVHSATKLAQECR